MESDTKKINCYTYGEGKTNNGQSVEFTCNPDDKELVKEFLDQKIRSIDIPCTKRINIQHGGYGRYTRYDITQHDYAGGRGYIEVLEIKNPPDERVGIVIYDYACNGNSFFTEWDSVENARQAYQTIWHIPDARIKFDKLPGFVRKVDCGALEPWFYAIGDEVLIGDYTFPDGLQNDPVYRFGAKFLVNDNEGTPSIKTCMGTRFIEIKPEGYSKDTQRYRLIYWSDGTIWDERNQYPYWSSKGVFYTPKLIEDNQLWIVEAMKQFHELLAGNSTEFSVDFTDGNKFVGKVVKSNPKLGCAAGNYCLSVIIKGQEKPVVGWVHDFVPTNETPDIIAYAKREYTKVGKEIERIEITDSKVLPGGKKWAGVYYTR